MSNEFSSKFHTLFNTAKILKVVKIWQSYREFKGGNFFETQCICASSDQSCYIWTMNIICVYTANFHGTIFVSMTASFNALCLIVYGLVVRWLWSEGGSSSVEAQRPTRHIIGHFRDDFYRPDDQTNSVKALKETSWSSRSDLSLIHIWRCRRRG